MVGVSNDPSTNYSFLFLLPFLFSRHNLIISSQLRHFRYLDFICNSGFNTSLVVSGSFTVLESATSGFCSILLAFALFAFLALRIAWYLKERHKRFDCAKRFIGRYVYTVWPAGWLILWLTLALAYDISVVFSSFSLWFS